MINRIKVRQATGSETAAAPRLETFDDPAPQFSSIKYEEPTGKDFILRLLMWAAIAMAVFAGIKYIKTPRAAASSSAFVHEFDESLFESSVLGAKADQVWVVDFWAPWCSPCKQFAPEFDAAADKFAGRVSFGRMEVDGAPAVAQRYGIHVIPTVIMFKNGRVVEKTGGMPRDQLEEWINARL